METLVKLTVSSPAFDEGGAIPSKYTCDGEDVNPALYVEGLPEHARSVALIVEDPDAPGGTFDHWLLWNMPVVQEISENTTQGVAGTNDFGKAQYRGPCPPGGEHRYYFKVFALDQELKLRKGAGKEELLKAMEGHILASGDLMGKYRKGH